MCRRLGGDGLVGRSLARRELPMQKRNIPWLAIAMHARVHMFRPAHGPLARVVSHAVAARQKQKNSSLQPIQLPRELLAVRSLGRSHEPRAAALAAAREHWRRLVAVELGRGRALCVRRPADRGYGGNTVRSAEIAS
eukprot:COSAG04_NODE_2736_length_3656_cov_2.037672_4_plen_136_part_01